jgi:hypothetical protein
MPITIRCPSCSATAIAPDAAAGKKAACPKCKKMLIVPVPSHAVTPAAHHKPPVEVEEDIPVISQAVEEDDALAERYDKARSPVTPRWLWWAVGGVSVAVLVVVAVIIGVLLGRKSDPAAVAKLPQWQALPPALPPTRLPEPKSTPPSVTQFVAEARAGAKLLDLGPSHQQIIRLGDRLTEAYARLPGDLPPGADSHAKLIIRQVSAAQEISRAGLGLGGRGDDILVRAFRDAAANMRSAADRLEALYR